MNAKLEDISGLNQDEVKAVVVLQETINNPNLCNSFVEAIRWLRCLRGWFIYQGGSHVALHRASGDDRRIMLVVK